MGKSEIKSLIKCAAWGIMWSVILVIIALVIVNKTSYNMKDVLFIEGGIVIILGVLSSISGNSTGLSLQALGQNNAQYVSNANLEISRMEKEKNINSIKNEFKSSVNMVSLIIGGAVCIIINFII